MKNPNAVKSFWGGMFVTAILVEAAVVAVVFGNLTSFVPDLAIYIAGFGAILLAIVSGVIYLKHHSLHIMEQRLMEAHRKHSASTLNANHGGWNAHNHREVFDAEIIDEDETPMLTRRLDVTA